MKRLSLAILIAACAAGPALAQVDTGSIVGTIHDPSGATVPGATVTVTEVKTNVATRIVSDAAGAYIATALKIGTYSVSVDMPGFKKKTRQGIVLRVQDRLRIDLEIEVGDVSETLVISGEAPLVQTDRKSTRLNSSHSRAARMPSSA